MGAQKLGQPVPDSNLVSERKRSVPQATHLYMPLRCSFQVTPLKARSVPALRTTWNCMGMSCAFHSASVFTMAGNVR